MPYSTGQGWGRALQPTVCGARWQGQAVLRGGLRAAKAAWGTERAIRRGALVLAWWGRGESREIKALCFTNVGLDFPTPALRQLWDAMGHRSGLGQAGAGPR